MEAIEISIRGELFFFENNLTFQQIQTIIDFMPQYFCKNKEDICVDEFVDTIIHQFQIHLKRIAIIKVIAI